MLIYFFWNSIFHWRNEMTRITTSLGNRYTQFNQFQRNLKSPKESQRITKTNVKLVNKFLTVWKTNCLRNISLEVILDSFHMWKFALVLIDAVQNIVSFNILCSISNYFSHRWYLKVYATYVLHKKVIIQFSFFFISIEN